MNIFSKEMLMSSEESSEECTLTVITNPSNATCVLTYNGQSYTTKTLEVPIGAVVSYSISYTGYNTQTGSWTINNNVTKTITLVQTTYTLTVVTTPSAATCTITYDGVAHSGKTATVLAGTVISYSITHATYGTTTGSFTMNKDRTLTATGTSTSTDTTHNWTRPKLSKNGTMGGTSYACSCDTNYNANWQAWEVFDDDSSNNGWMSGAGHAYGHVIYYTPTAIKLTQATAKAYGVYGFTQFTIYGSNNNSSYTQLVTTTGTHYQNGSTKTLTSSKTGTYKYFKFYFKNDYYVAAISAITFKGTYTTSSTTYSWEKTVT